LREDWISEVGEMSSRIKSMRLAIREKLEEKTGTSWKHVTDQIGMFSYTGLSKEQVMKCREESVYMLDSGRVSVAGVNEGNLERICEVIGKAVEE